MKFLGNTVVFVILYILFMIPTYLLPYVGSNSTVVLTALFMEGKFTEVPFFFVHAAAMLILIVITWFRGALLLKKWLIIFPILATVFDFTPGLNLVPFVPTVMHLLAIILGVIGSKATAPTQGAAT